MKKLSFLFLACISVLINTSCLKNYSCKCTTTLSAPGYYPHQTITIQDIKKHASKKKATQICNNVAKQLYTNTHALMDPSVFVTANCILKDY